MTAAKHKFSEPKVKFSNILSDSQKRTNINFTQKWDTLSHFQAETNISFNLLDNQ